MSYTVSPTTTVSSAVDARLAHRGEHHAGIGLRGRIVGGLDRDEVIEQAVMAEHEPHAALRFSRRDAEHDIFAPRERLDRLARAGIERLDVRAALAHRMEGELCSVRRGLQPEIVRGPFPSSVKASVSDSPIDREHRFALGNRELVRRISLAHGAQIMCWLSTSVPSQSKMTNFNGLAIVVALFQPQSRAINGTLWRADHPQ